MQPQAFNTIRRFALTAVASAMLAPSAFAQQDEEADQGGFLDEIIVTAQKREQSVQDVPIAVTVLDSEKIDNAHSVGFEGLQQLVPSVSFRKGNTNRNSAVVVRGIGTISFSTAAEPSVSTVVDGVVLGRSGQAFTDLYDLERLEVLRGPQGTLFGKNASAGVVNLTTRKPSSEFEASIDFSAFEDEEYRLKGRLSGPLSDNARASLTVFDGSFDGYIRNTFNGDTIQGYDRQGARGMLEWDATDNVKFLFIAEDYSADDDCCADLSLLPNGRDPNSPANPNSAGVVNGVADLDLDQRLVDHDLTTRTLDDSTSFSMQIDAGLGEYTLTSITAYREWDNTEIREGDFTSTAGDFGRPVDFSSTFFQLHDIGEQSWEQFSQELRIASPVGEKFTWQAGLFYWNLQSDRRFRRDASCQVHPNNAPILAANPGLTCLDSDIVAATANFDTEFDNFSVFGEGSLALSENVDVVFGLRYTDDEVSFNHRRINDDPFGRRGVGVRGALNNTDFTGTTDETDTSGKLGITWAATDSSLLYATYSQGYKGPAFNVFYNQAVANTLPISSESSEQIELGYKLTTGNLFANFAIFTTDIEDLQANNIDTSLGTATTTLTNAGDISTEGVEVEFVWQPSENFQLSGGVASIDAEIDRFNCPVGVPASACTDRSGLDVPFSPDLKYSLNANYVMEFSNFDMIFDASFVHMDEQLATLPSNSGTFAPQALLPDYDILNASLAFSFADDKYRLTLIGKNLGDESYVTTFSGDGFRYQIPRDAERYFGASFRANF